MNVITEEEATGALTSLPSEIMVQEIASLLPLRERSYLLCRLCKSLATRYTRLDAIGTYRAPVRVFWSMYHRGLVLFRGLREFARDHRDTGPMIVAVTRIPDHIVGPQSYVSEDDDPPFQAVSFECSPDDYHFMPANILRLVSTVTTLEADLTSAVAYSRLPSNLHDIFPRLQTIRIPSYSVTREPATRNYLTCLFSLVPGVRIHWDILEFFPEEALGLAPDRIQTIDYLYLTKRCPKFFYTDSGTTTTAAATVAHQSSRVRLLHQAKVIKVVQEDETDILGVQLLNLWAASLPQETVPFTDVIYVVVGWPSELLSPRAASLVTYMKITLPYPHVPRLCRCKLTQYTRLNKMFIDSVDDSGVMHIYNAIHSMYKADGNGVCITRPSDDDDQRLLLTSTTQFSADALECIGAALATDPSPVPV